MNLIRFKKIITAYPKMRVAVIGDFCLDRYLEIDPSRSEVSIETGLPVHNVVSVRAQPGGAGTILNNLVALGVGEIYPVGFCGDDGEGFELRRALGSMRGIRLDHFITTRQRRTFTYCKPLLLLPNSPPEELSRLDSKNWTETPGEVQSRLMEGIKDLAGRVHAMILLDQVDMPDTGVVTRMVRDTVGSAARMYPSLTVVADGRRGLAGFPPLLFKMNLAELARTVPLPADADEETVIAEATDLAVKNKRPVVITMADRGMIGVAADGKLARQPALSLRGPIDVVGAGDSVTANLTTALAAGATMPEALELATAAASTVIHQLGTTGTATILDLFGIIAANIPPEPAPGGTEFLTRRSQQ